MNQIDERLKDYAATLEITIHWGEQDANGHVNHGSPVRWLESARIAYIRDNGSMTAMMESGLSPIIASLQMQYRRQLTFPDMAVIGTRVTQLGRTSMTIEQGIFSREQDALAIEAEVRVVMFDHEAQRPRRIPASVVELLRADDVGS